MEKPSSTKWSLVSKRLGPVVPEHLKYSSSYGNAEVVILFNFNKFKFELKSGMWQVPTVLVQLYTEEKAYSSQVCQLERFHLILANI